MMTMVDGKNEIQCPSCGESISIAAALAAEIEDKYEKSFQKKISQYQAELRKKSDAFEEEKSAFESAKELMQKEMEKKIREDLAKSNHIEMEDLRQQLSEREKKLQLAAQSELELRKKSRLLDEKEQTLELELQRKIDEEKQKLSSELAKKVSENSLQNKLQLEELQQQLSEKEKKLVLANQNELELRKKSRELEEKEKALELEVQRKFDNEKQKLSDDVAKRVSEDYRQKSMEKDKQLDDMRKQIEDLKRKSDLGSQQNQGEVLELEIETRLRSLFPADLIEPVPKGMKGADVIQKIITPSGQVAGSIVWEMKQTKAWSDGWVEKLKEDQRAITAEFAIIVSSVLPKGISHFGQMDGVWITNLQTVSGLAHALRNQTLQLFHARNMADGKNEKMEFIYQYLTGTQFRQRVETIVESFTGMKEDLDKEKRAIQKIWAAREQQLTRVISSTVGMYGDIQGIVGVSFPKIPSLEFDSVEGT